MSPDRHDLYERCAQSPSLTVGMLRAIHARSPRILAEDFCGTALVSREWVASDPRARAIATDLDPAALARARGIDRLTLRRADILRSPPRSPADIIHAGNFSIGEIHDRDELVRYLARCRTRLRARGLFLCDIYGGESAFRIESTARTHTLARGLRIHYTWEQRRADQGTGMVENVMHFRVTRRSRTIARFPDAFTYHWRLWSIPELRDAMHDAGFRKVEIYDRSPDAVDQNGRFYALPLNPDELGLNFVALIAAHR